MKINKMICIDEENNKKLDGINASELINRLIKEHFSEETEQNIGILKKKFAENAAILKESKRKDKQLRAFIDKIEQKEKRIVGLQKKLTEEQIRELRDIAPITILNWKYHRKLFEGFTMQQVIEMKGGLKNGI